ncbi:MAG: radical SAM protein, partial [Actinomycetota bacterium]|nr:radical SAM protein [Actinomycetota bacterium]
MSMLGAVTQRVKSGSVAAAVNIARMLPEKQMMSISERFISTINYPEGRDFLRTAMFMIKRRLPELSPSCQRGVVNFMSNLVTSAKTRDELYYKEGISAPFLIVVSPTMRCNLRCTGCYAGEYETKEDLPKEVMDRVLTEAEEMGICFVVISGGEPFAWPHLLDTFRNHPDIFFQIYTNGTLIDREMALELSKIGNALPCISVEGFEDETDERRGRGIWRRGIEAMENLREAGVLFGFSATATSANNDLVVSDEFVDFYISRGCTIGWYFNYIPIGRFPDMSLMTTPEQRIGRRERLVELRGSKKILLADFWNDGPLVGGCMAGGRLYLHINSDGAAEPCVFSHFAQDNIKEKTLIEVLKSDLFREIRLRQPYSSNLF